MFKVLEVAFVAAACVAASACGVTDACTLLDAASFSVSVVDSASGLPAAAGSSVVLISSTFRDSVLVPVGDTSAFAAIWFESKMGPGRYAVRVQQSGYRVWTASDLVVLAGGCHVANAQNVTARLQR